MSNRVALFRIAGMIGILSLGACADRTGPVVDQDVVTDESGKKFTVYRICEPSREFFGLAGQMVCRIEKIPHRYCYKTIGNIDCYLNPLPGKDPQEAL